jgi:hypothetical protein
MAMDRSHRIALALLALVAAGTVWGTVAWSTGQPTTYQTRLNWYVADPPPTGQVIPDDFIIEAATAFEHPYNWQQLATLPVLPAQSITPNSGVGCTARLAATQVLPSRRECAWDAPVIPPGPVYRWYRVSSRKAGNPAIVGTMVIEPNRQEVQISTDPFP